MWHRADIEPRKQIRRAGLLRQVFNFIHRYTRISDHRMFFTDCFEGDLRSRRRA
jgi:hypothetical protein